MGSVITGEVEDHKELNQRRSLKSQRKVIEEVQDQLGTMRDQLSFAPNATEGETAGGTAKRSYGDD